VSKKTYSLNKIKYWFCYDIDDICRLFGVHPKTALSWFKQGLKAVDSRQPFLVHGYQLKAFLGKLNESNKCITSFEEMFCVKCREPRNPLKKQIIIEQFEKKFLRVKAICQSCKTKMNKPYQLDNLQQLKRVFDVVQLLELCDSKTPTSNPPFLDQEKNPKKEPEKTSIQLDLFS
jgi:hypothetical protein